MEKLSRQEAKHIILQSQGLTDKNPFGIGITGTRNAILHLGYIQLDTLSVVERAHHHTLWNRNKSYTPLHLQTLVREGKVFEYWSHAASYLPMEDFRFSLPRKALHKSGHAHWFSRNKKLKAYVLDRIRAEGPLQSRDFETDRKRGSWFDWKPAKIALEQLFMEGSLMVRSRQGFQKVYDLTERVVPAGTNMEKPSDDEYAEYLVRFNLRALGIASVKDFTHLRAGMLPAVTRALRRLIKNGELRPLEVEGVKDVFYQWNSEHVEQVLHKSFHILSPFDNLIIRRERINKLFDWDYNLECYLPEQKRKYGYFCLPILYKGNFAGMFDPKADRSTGKFHIKQFHLAKEKMSGEFYSELKKKLHEFAAYNGCDKIVCERQVPLIIRKELAK